MSVISKNVLVVDDESDVRKLIVTALVEAGYNVADLDSAVGLFDIVLESSPDLIVLDLTMPEIDGLGALNELKSDPRTAHVPVVIVSAQAQRETMIRARDLGATDFIHKPWDDGEVEWRVGNILGVIDAAA